MAKVLATVCPNCNRKYRMTEDKAGRRVRCQNCGTIFNVMLVERSQQAPHTLKPLTSMPTQTTTGKSTPTAPIATGTETATILPSPSPAEISSGQRSSPSRSSTSSRFSSGSSRVLSLRKDESTVATDWTVGDIILDLYEVTGILGEGAMGKVYQVHHLGWDVDLAVKSPRPETLARVGGAENFEREAEVWVNLGLYPHTVSCYYVRRLGEIPRVFAEYVQGGSLQSWIRKGKLRDLAQMIDVAIQFAWGLQHAHQQQLIHQDVKPENVMMTPEGIAKVTDFGLARARGLSSLGQDTAGLTAEQTLLATLGGMTRAYCSPEQARGLALARTGVPREQRPKLTRESDIWSWAVSILEMFTGTILWESGDKAPQGLAIYRLQGPGMTGIPRMPASLDRLLQHCFQLNPDERPQSMLEVATTLQAIYQEITGLPYPRQFPSSDKALADSLNNRAVSLLDLGKRNEAKQLWDQAIAVDPQHIESLYNRGLLLWRSGRLTDDALIDLLTQKVREIRASRPEEWTPAYLLAQVHLERQDYPQALVLLQNLLDTVPAEDQEEIRSMVDLAEQQLPNSQRLLQTCTGHSLAVLAVDLEEQKRYGLSGSEDNTLKLWDLQQGICVRTLTGHTDAVWAVRFLAGGQEALSASRDATIKLWDLSNGKCLRTLTGHGNGVHTLQITGDGYTLLSGSYDNTLKLWDLATGACLLTLAGHAWASVGLSNDGQWILSGGYQSLRYWQIHWPSPEMIKAADLRAEVVRTVQVSRTVYGISLSQDGRYALLVSGHGSISPEIGVEAEVLEIATGERVNRLRGHTQGVEAGLIQANGQWAVTAGRDATLKLWDLTQGRCLRTFAGHTQAVTSLAWDQEGEYVLSGGQDQTVRLWQMKGSEQVLQAPLLLCRVQASEMALSTEMAYESALQQADQAMRQGDVVTAAAQIRIARAQPGCQRRSEAMRAWSHLYTQLERGLLLAAWEERTLSGHQGYITAIDCAGRLQVVSASEDETLKLWDASTGACLCTLSGHRGFVTSAALSRDGRQVLSGSEDNSVKLWDLETGQCLCTCTGHTAYVTSVCLLSEEHQALSGSYHDQTLRLWDLKTGDCLRIWSGVEAGITSIALSRDHRRLLTSGYQTLQLWDLARGECLRRFTGVSDMVRSVSISPDGQYGLSGSYDSTLQVWDLSSGDCVQTLTGHTAWINSVAISPDGRYALSGSQDKTVKLWSLASRECLRTFEGHSGGINSVCFSPDHRYALSAGRDKTVKIWQLDWDLIPPAPRSSPTKDF